VIRPGGAGTSPYPFCIPFLQPVEPMALQTGRTEQTLVVGLVASQGDEPFAPRAARLSHPARRPERSRPSEVLGETRSKRTPVLKQPSPRLATTVSNCKNPVASGSGRAWGLIHRVYVNVIPRIAVRVSSKVLMGRR